MSPLTLLLEAANVAGRTAQDWPTRVEAPAAAKALHDRFGTGRPNQFLSTRAAARVRLLVQRVVPAV